MGSKGHSKPPTGRAVPPSGLGRGSPSRPPGAPGPDVPDLVVLRGHLKDQRGLDRRAGGLWERMQQAHLRGLLGLASVYSFTERELPFLPQPFQGA